MVAHGERDELISQVRRVGPRLADAAERLGLSVRIVSEMGEDVFALDPFEGYLWGGSEWAVWVGVAQFVAIEDGLEVNLSDMMAAASAMLRRSGVFLQIA